MADDHEVAGEARLRARHTAAQASRCRGRCRRRTIRAAPPVGHTGRWRRRSRYRCRNRSRRMTPAGVFRSPARPRCRAPPPCCWNLQPWQLFPRWFVKSVRRPSVVERQAVESSTTPTNNDFIFRLIHDRPQRTPATRQGADHPGRIPSATCYPVCRNTVMQSSAVFTRRRNHGAYGNRPHQRCICREPRPLLSLRLRRKLSLRSLTFPDIPFLVP